MMSHIKRGSCTQFQIKIRQVTSSGILFPSLALFIFLMLYYIFVMFVLTFRHAYSALLLFVSNYKSYRKYG